MGKLRDYVAHRWEREEQVLSALAKGIHDVGAIVEIIYAAYPTFLHAAAGQSVGSHLLKLERESRVRREGDSATLATEVSWYMETEK